MLKQANRLQRSDDVTRVRKTGAIKRHPLAILLYQQSPQEGVRFAFIASKRVGNAVVRNRAKRLLREAVRIHIPAMESGWECVVIARVGINGVLFQEVQTAVYELLSRANLLLPHYKLASP